MDVNINIVTTQINEIGEKNIIKSNVSGTLYIKKDHKYAIYKEIQDSEEITTSLKIEDDKVTIKRFGSLDSTLKFKVGNKDISRYVTQQGVFIIENHTKKLDIIEKNGIFINIDYDIKIMDVFTGKNIIKIEITEK